MTFKKELIKLGEISPALRPHIRKVLAATEVAWVLTVPKTTSWATYTKELQDVADGSKEMLYKVRGFPKDMKKGHKCYIVHDGFVRGYMGISSLQDNEGFTCETTGTEWAAGKYIGRTGKFHTLETPVEMQGFRGIRKYTSK